MNTKSSVLIAGALAIALSGCARVETGEVGLRVGFDKQVSPTELQPGSFNQVLVGDVLHFQVRSIAATIEIRNPQTADNSTMKDFDLTAIYDVNPAAVSELWTQQSRAFHVLNNDGETYLMYNYMTNIINSAAHKAVRAFKALEVADKRSNIEQKIKTLVEAVLKEEGLDKVLTLSQVQVRTTQLSDDIVASANSVVRATNDLNAKTIEVETSKKEAERLTVLAQNKGNIDYMQAKALSDIAEGVKNGKVNSIIVPVDFKGMISVKQ